MKHKVAYLAGPYRSYKKDGTFNIDGIFTNILKAREVAKKYWHLGYAVITPHLNTMLMDGDFPDEMWLDGDLAMIEKVDVVIMMNGFESSKGSTAELEYAKSLGKEIIYD